MADAQALKFVYFDCMDTLVQMDIPGLQVLPLWAWEGAQSLGLWSDAADFQQDWSRERQRFLDENGSLREDTIIRRIERMLRRRLEADAAAADPAASKVEELARRIHECYWRSYRAASYVLPDVRPTLEWLQSRGLRLGVVSNFMVPGGIDELLRLHGLDGFFASVVVSCDVGWRKPSDAIFQRALELAALPAAEILFVGDNPLADYDGPRLAGMKPVLYDPRGQEPALSPRIRSFGDLPPLIWGPPSR